MRRHMARGITFEVLDLDDLGAEIAQDLRAERAGQELGHVEDAQMRERALAHHARPLGFSGTP